MNRDTRGLSAVVTTLIIILLVLVAVGIIWVVVNNVVKSGAETIDYTTKCLDVQLEAVGVTESDTTPGTYSITLKRLSGTEDISGVKVNFFNTTDNSGVLEFGYALGSLDTKTNSSIVTTLLNANKIEFTAYFLDSSGNDHYCDTNTYTF